MSQQYDNTNRGVLFRNDRKTSDKHPDYQGNGNYKGQDFRISAWLKTSKAGKKYFSFSFEPPEERGEESQAAPSEEPGF